MTASDSIKQAWQAAAADPALPDLDEVRIRAGSLYRQVRRRNRVEYVAALFVILFFGAAAWSLTETLARMGAGLVVCGAIVGAWQLHRRASALEPPGDCARSLVAHQRAQLVRQRDALATIGTWYVLPLLPGIALFVIGRLTANGPTRLSDMGWGQLLAIGFIVLVFAGTWLMNQAASRALQIEIDALDGVGGETQ